MTTSNLTLTLPAEWLRDVHPQFELLKHEDSTIRRMTIELLTQAIALQAADRLTWSDPADAVPTPGKKLRVMTSVPAAQARALAHFARVRGTNPGESARALLYSLWMSHAPEAAKSTSAGSPLRDLLSAMGGREERAEQVAAFSCIEDAMKQGRIGMVEASTGVGKAMAAMFAAVRWTADKGVPVVVAAPTLPLVRQLVAEYRSIAAARDCPPCQAVFGRREFVNEGALIDLLEAKPDLDSPQVRGWLAQGGRGPESDDVEAAWLCESLRHLAPDFPIDEVRVEDICSPTDRGLLAYRGQFRRPEGGGGETDGDERGFEPRPLVIICTHAMLAQDLRIRWRRADNDTDFSRINAELLNLLKGFSKLKGEEQDRGEERYLHHLEVSKTVALLGEAFRAESIEGMLPRHGGLIVDEAHQLEQAFSNAFSECLPLQKLLRQVLDYKKHGGQVSAAVVETVRSTIRSVASSASGRMRSRSDLTPLASPDLLNGRLFLADCLAALAPIAARKAAANTPAARAAAHFFIKRAVGTLRLVLNGGMSRAYLRLSPTRAYPQLYVAHGNVDKRLEMLWASVDAGVALSATLYLLRSDGPSPEYMRSLLRIPSERLAVFPPIEARWLAEPIASVDVVEGPRAERLRPPVRSDKLDEATMALHKQRWLDNLASELRAIHETAVGGVLVLNTSYEMVQGLTSRLLGRAEWDADAQVESNADDPEDALTGPLEQVLVAAREGVSVSTQARTFLTLQATGHKPLWLAVGGAWTGLDLGGHDVRTRLAGLPPLPAGEDFVLTDLVLPRLPFGTNNSITHRRRLSLAPSIPWDLLDAAFRFRQALGRLVRRMGLPKVRRVHILDGRLAEPGAQGRLAVFWSTINKLKARLRT